MSETVRVTITNWDDDFTNQVSVIESDDDPTVFGIVVLNADWSNV